MMPGIVLQIRLIVGIGTHAHRLVRVVQVGFVARESINCRVLLFKSAKRQYAAGFSGRETFSPFRNSEVNYLVPPELESLHADGFRKSSIDRKR